MFMRVLCVRFPLISWFLSWVTLSTCLRLNTKWRQGTSQALGGSSLSTSGTPETPGDSNRTEQAGWESHRQR